MSTEFPAASEHPVKARMRAGSAALGMIARLSRSGDIARIAKSTGHDFVFVDGQHSLFSLETIGHIAQAALGCGIAPLVRVRSPRDPDVALLLDNGVTGIVFPDVATVDDARAAVEACRYPPLGKRSVCGAWPHFDFRPTPMADAIARLDEHCLVVCMIETRAGIENVEAIAAVDGIDVLHVGTNDLLTDMGKPGRFGDPEIMDAIARVIAAASANGKHAGIGGDRNIERQRDYVRQGARFLTTQTDIGFLMAEASRVTAALRESG